MQSYKPYESLYYGSECGSEKSQNYFSSNDPVSRIIKDYKNSTLDPTEEYSYQRQQDYFQTFAMRQKSRQSLRKKSASRLSQQQFQFQGSSNRKQINTENERLKEENEELRRQIYKLKKYIEKVEGKSNGSFKKSRNMSLLYEESEKSYQEHSNLGFHDNQQIVVLLKNAQHEIRGKDEEIKQLHEKLKNYSKKQSSGMLSPKEDKRSAKEAEDKMRHMYSIMIENESQFAMIIDRTDLLQKQILLLNDKFKDILKLMMKNECYK